jgi:PAS domain S-box-containing protein
MEKQEKVLVIHPDDRSTDFLKPIYAGITNATVITGGYSKAEVLGQKPHLLHKPEEAAQLSNPVIEGTLRDGHWSGELPILRKDTSEGICETNTILLRDNLEQVIAIIGVNRDITERKQNEKALQQKTKQEQLLFKVSQVIRQSLDLNQILETATQKIKEIIGKNLMKVDH